MVAAYWVAEVGLAFLALFVGLLCYGVGGLFKAIANAIKPIHLIFGITIDIGGIFRDAGNAVGNFFIGLGEGLFGYMEDIFRAVASSLVGVFGFLKNALWALVQHIEYLYGVGIPNASNATRNTANAYSDDQLQLVRTEIRAATVKWGHAHTYNDAVSYIALEAAAPSVEHAFLAAQAQTMLASFAHAQDLHDQLYDYIGKHVTGQADVALPYTGQTLSGVAGAIAIPGPVDLSNVDVQDIIKTGSQIAVGTAVAVIATKIVECLVSNCAGNNNFNQLLQDALGLVSLAEFAVFVEALVKDPAATLTTYIAPVEGLIRSGSTDLSDVWGAVEAALGL